MSYGAFFTSAHPKAVDLPQAEYDQNKAAVDAAADAAGYRLAGFRLQRAVFTTKPNAPVSA